MGSIGGGSNISLSVLDALEEEDNDRVVCDEKKRGHDAIGKMGLAGEEGPERKRRFEG